MNTSKDKIIKEKNIKNEIVKYQIQIVSNVTITNINDGSNIQFSKSEYGDYNVTNQYSRTLNNEKKLIELLSEKIVEEILEEISLKFNAI